MRALLIDNHDSYTYNLFQFMAEVYGSDPVVVSNEDPLLTTDRAGAFDAIVVSPGPGRPQAGRDLGHVLDLLDRLDLPILGVCLGHQAIAHAAGGTVTAAPRARHGHLSKIKHDDDALFAGIPSEFIAVRYHSLCVEEPLPEALEATAWAEDGVVMAFRHRDRPRWGVQFHPESIATEYGRELLANFRDLSLRAGTSSPTGRRRSRPAVQDLRVTAAVVERAVDPEHVFTGLYAQAPTCFWLDSSRAEPGLARFSFLGDSSGPLSEVLTYRVGAGAVQVRTADGLRVESGNIFELLERRLRERRIPEVDLPFDLSGGYVGYFGYEMKAESGGQARYRSPNPDAAWIFADRLVVVDHEQGRTYAVAVHPDDPRARSEAEQWTAATAARLGDLPDLGVADDGAELLVDGVDLRRRSRDETLRDADRVMDPGHDRARYIADIEECRRQLVRGESYEICLTTSVRLPLEDEDTAFYRRLRRVNPAPYAALLRVAGVTVFSSSPERFIRIDRNGMVESKPIKGTAPRSDDPEEDARIAAELASSPKTRAELLMIVDLLRNDLGQVCDVGSVRVDRYMAVESYATVHQLVSTIQGQLRTDVSPVECVRRCFPGGSMTGAPKQRTMEIIDRLETGPRGIYSGTLGYFGLTGAADLNIVIRTAVRNGDTITVGAGGAIVLDSDPAEEYDEMRLKAATPLRAWRPTPADTADEADEADGGHPSEADRSAGATVLSQVGGARR